MDIELYYQEEGNGESFIFLHGNGENSSYFKKQIDYFQSKYRVIALDTRGHGKSPRGKAPFTIEQFACDLYDFMTGIQYLNFVADIFGVGAGERQERIRKYADAFELTESLAQGISAYSHGMKQKLALISALIHEPKLVIMDEPFVGLDPKAAHLLKGFMRDICDRGGAIFFSTHVLEVAEKLCDKVAIIKGGKLIRSGTMDEVRGDESLESVFLELEEA